MEPKEVKANACAKVNHGSAENVQPFQELVSTVRRLNASRLWILESQAISKRNRVRNP
jgi:hypothetical protein